MSRRTQGSGARLRSGPRGGLLDSGTRLRVARMGPEGLAGERSLTLAARTAHGPMGLAATARWHARDPLAPRRWARLAGCWLGSPLCSARLRWPARATARSHRGSRDAWAHGLGGRSWPLAVRCRAGSAASGGRWAHSAARVAHGSYGSNVGRAADSRRSGGARRRWRARRALGSPSRPGGAWLLWDVGRRLPAHARFRPRWQLAVGGRRTLPRGAVGIYISMER